MTEREKVPGYMSGALTGLMDRERKTILRFYERVAEIAARYGIDLYLPHQHSDPIKDKNLSPRQVYEMDETRIKEAHLMIAEVSQPSHGVGSELIMAWKFGTNVILIGQQDRLRQLREDPVDSIIFENPAIQFVISYDKPDGALGQLESLFKEKGEELKTKRIFPPIPDFYTTFVLSGRKIPWQGRAR